MTLTTQLKRFQRPLQRGENIEVISQHKESHQHRSYEIYALILLGIIAIAVRVVPIFRYQVPTGWDTRYYVGILQGDPTSVFTNTIFAYFTLRALGTLFVRTQLFPLSQLILVELIPTVFNLLISLTMYSLGKKLTGSSRVGLLAGIFTALSLRQLRITSDLYRNMMAIPLLLVALQSYNNILQKRNLRGFVVVFLLLCTIPLIHPAPALILFLTMTTYAVACLFWRFNLKERLLRSTLTIALLLSVGFVGTALANAFHWSYWLVGEPWPHEPITPAHKLSVITNDGKEILPLSLAIISVPFLLKRRKEDSLLILSWTAVSFILAEQSLFHLYCPYIPEGLKLPRFLMHFTFPMSILASISVEEIVKKLTGVHAFKIAEGVRLHTLNTRKLGVLMFLCSMLLVSSLFIWSQVMTLGPVVSLKDYQALYWLEVHSPQNSTVDTSRNYYTELYAILTHLNPRGDFTAYNYYVQIGTDADPLNRDPNYNKIYDNGWNDAKFFYVNV
jgi:hypothetical protein